MTMTQHCEIACQRLSFTQEEQKNYLESRSRVFEHLVRTEELENGYSFVLRKGQSLLHDLADWLPLENKCCPFLQMTLSLYGDEYVRLQLTGPQEVKAFLLHELDLVKE
jgi:hypothetical protein